MGAYCSKKDELKLQTTAEADYSHEVEPDFQGFQIKLLDDVPLTDPAEVNKVFGFYEGMTLREPENPQWLGKMGYCLLAKGRFDEAETVFRKTMSLSKDIDGKIYFTLAGICQKKGKTEEARDLYQAALEKDPGYAKVYVKLGELSLNRKEYAAALGYFQKAGELDVSDAEAHSGLGLCLLYLDRLHEAVDQLTTAVTLCPTLARAHNSLANAYRKQGNLDEAIKHYIQAIDNTPKRTHHTGNFSAAHLNLAAAYFDVGDTASGLRHFEEAMHSGGHIHKIMVAKGYHLLFKHPRIRDGIELYLCQRYVAARDTLVEVRAQDKKNMVVAYYLANCCWKLGQEDLAESLFSEVIQLGTQRINADRHFLRGFARRAEKQLAIIQGNYEEDESEAASILNHSVFLCDSPQPLSAPRSRADSLV